MNVIVYAIAYLLSNKKSDFPFPDNKLEIRKLFDL
jgi:hypothetical protein